MLPSGETVSRAIQGNGHQAAALMVGATICNRVPTIEIVCTIASKIFQIKKKKEL